MTVQLQNENGEKATDANVGHVNGYAREDAFPGVRKDLSTVDTHIGIISTMVC